MPRRKSHWKIVLAIIVVVIILVIIAWRVMQAQGAPQRGATRRAANQAPVPVTVVPVTQENVPVYLTATGTVQALNTVTVQPQVGGRLLSINFNGGKPVTKGEVLARIDPRTYQATYDQAVARMHADEAQLDTAQTNLASSNKLIKKHYVSQQEVDTQANTVKQLKATVEADKAAVEQARINLDYTKINAPISGIAGIRQVDPGNVVSTNTAIVVLTHVHPINVMFTLPSEDLDLVRKAQAQSPLSVVALQSATQKVLADNGVLKVINNQIDPNTSTFTLKSQFPNQHTELWPGQYVRVRMKVNIVKNGLVVPTQAVQRGPNGDYVYVVQQDNTVKMQPITVTGQVGDTHELVGKGVVAGDRVVTEGQFRLKPDSKVRPLKPGEVPVGALSSAGAKPSAVRMPASGMSVGNPPAGTTSAGKAAAPAHAAKASSGK